MRAQRRRFVVEVKRGTNRAAFISQDTVADKFSSAEDALFGSKKASVPVFSHEASRAERQSAGRILPDLQEPPPPPPEAPLPARRGRKPGSKNKPKLLPTAAEAAPAAATVSRVETSPLPADGPAADIAPSPGSNDAAAPTRRPRFRERSTILKRYVLGTEPALGQPGWTRRRRIRRQG